MLNLVISDRAENHCTERRLGCRLGGGGICFGSGSFDDRVDQCLIDIAGRGG